MSISANYLTDIPWTSYSALSQISIKIVASRIPICHLSLHFDEKHRPDDFLFFHYYSRLREFN